jgi:FMN phosphatase YigB (HAD superfamily)
VKTWKGSNFKVLFFDIDETLIHCIDENDPSTMQGQERLRINLNGYTSQYYKQNQEDQPDFIDIDINLRPGLYDCL